MRLLLVTATLLLTALPAWAECRLEVLEAANRISASGPFHFETVIRNDDREQKIQGRAVPSEEALEIRYISGAYDDRLAELHKDGRHWVRDAFGWFRVARGDPDSALRAFLPASALNSISIPPFTEQMDCPGTVEVDGQQLTMYRVKNDYSLYLDPTTSLVVRYEKIHNGGLSEETVTTYRYDNTIVIQTPNVDLAERQRASNEALEAAKRRSDPVCRNEAFRAIELGLNSGPFHVEIWQHDFHLTRTYLTKGSLQPWRAFHLKHSGLGLHDGGIESIFIEGEEWIRHSDGSWKPAEGLNKRSDSMQIVMRFLKPNLDDVGFVRCVPKHSPANEADRLYEFVIYEERDHAFKPSETRRMFVDRKTGVPIKSEKLHPIGKWMLTERRVYDPGIQIVPPQ